MAKKELKEVTLDGKVKITVNIPKKLLTQMDEVRKITNHTRSSWVTTSIMEKLAKRLKTE
jgi:metal-responsive CopG/Arc/MetJ family transcriptional regulator